MIVALRLLMGAALASVMLTPHAAAQQPRVTTVRGDSVGTVSAAAVKTAPTANAKRTPRENVKESVVPSEITLQRETFSYSGSGRRDPYKSLMSSSDVRPLLSDLRLTAVAFAPAGSNSVAILRDSYSKTQYRVRVGQQLGRLRVSGIRQKAVQFTIEEFGFNRQETLPLSSDTTKVRNP
jgi:hypothetical protein